MLTTTRFCERHKKAAEKRRGSREARGYDWTWRKLRNAWLRNNPLCVACKAEGRINAATVVDHIKPHRGNDALRLDTSNLNSLCVTHHNRKTATEDTSRGPDGRWE